jgi:hypothetical protein
MSNAHATSAGWLRLRIAAWLLRVINPRLRRVGVRLHPSELHSKSKACLHIYAYSKPESQTGPIQLRCDVKATEAHP